MNKMFTELKNSQAMKLIEDFDSGCNLQLETREVRIIRELEHCVYVSITNPAKYNEKGERIPDPFFVTCEFWDDGNLHVQHLAHEMGPGTKNDYYFKPGMADAYKELLLTVLKGDKLDEYIDKLQSETHTL